MSQRRWRIEATALPDRLRCPDQIEGQVDRIARRLGGPPGMRPDFGRSRDDGTPHIEVGTRRPHEDSRRQLFRYWREQLASLDEDWARRVDREISAILEKHPFIDR